ncbi:MAG: HAD family hydrolase [Clostridia bacterium]|nr:HAD family hydrolase [Clostridia bacterium]
MIKAVIFDLDGTLADTLSGITHFVNRTTAAYGLSSISAERTKVFVGNGAKVLLERTFTHLGLSELPEGALALYNALYDAHATHDLHAYDGIPALLDMLKQRGIKIAVLSNKPHTAVLPVCTYLFGDKLDFILGQKEGVPRKPEIIGVKMVWEALGVCAEECLYVGDTDCDMQTGKNAGMFTVGVAWGFRTEKELWDNGADTVIHHPQELFQYL